MTSREAPWFESSRLIKDDDLNIRMHRGFEFQLYAKDEVKGNLVDINKPYLELIEQIILLSKEEKTDEIRRRWEQIEEITLQLKHQAIEIDGLSYVIKVIIRLIETKGKTSIGLSLMLICGKRLFRILVGLEETKYSKDLLMMNSAKLLHKNILLLKELYGIQVKILPSTDWEKKMFPEVFKLGEKVKVEEESKYPEYIANL